MHGAIFRYRMGLSNNFRRYSLYKSKTEAIRQDGGAAEEAFSPD
jgi:hypothetical protein